jgi:hypothetical protein
MGIGSTQAAVLQVSGGELTGALGVNVGGTLYDVQFVEGTCPALFSGCDDPSDFAFNTQSAADQASQALLGQVFVNGAQGNFDTQPELTFGCEEFPAFAVCQAWTPFDPPEGVVFGSASVAVNAVAESGDNVSFGSFSEIADMTTSPIDVWARWNLVQVQPAGAPGALSLIALGLLGLAWSRFRRA